MCMNMVIDELANIYIRIVVSSIICHYCYYRTVVGYFGCLSSLVYLSSFENRSIRHIDSRNGRRWYDGCWGEFDDTYIYSTFDIIVVVWNLNTWFDKLFFEKIVPIDFANVTKYTDRTIIHSSIRSIIEYSKHAGPRLPRAIRTFDNGDDWEVFIFRRLRQQVVDGVNEGPSRRMFEPPD
jgi:hypothetical protein